jgi:hypothetical protein
VYLVVMSTAETTVRGIAVAVSLAGTLPASGLLPHESVDPRSVRRRVAALRKARVDREPVLLTHSGGGLAVAAAARTPEHLFEVERQGVRAIVSRVPDVDADIVLADLTRRTCLIADGHHRLTAALEHATTCRRRHADLAGDSDSAAAEGDTCLGVSALVVDGDDTPLLLDPIHRVLHRRGPVPLRAAEVAARFAAMPANSIAPAAELAGSLPPVTHPRRGGPGVPGPTEPPRRRHAVRVVDRAGAVEVSAEPSAGRPTTAHVVEHVIDGLGLPHVRRIPDPGVASAAAARRGTVALLLPAVSPTDILDTVSAGLLMPVKATFFRPKLPAGIVVRPLSAHW